MRSDLVRKCLAYGVLGVIAAGLGFLFTWTLTKRMEHHVWAKDRGER